MTEEVTENWRRVRNENLHNCYFSSNIIKAIKLKERRWAFI
jgi:hypothetical protein